ncbi:MAG TPA: TetR family transcriptional regulator [Pseudonocardia sp.]|nr:TetR family transcriptional regulator [Pseudonocardia sp.]
MTRPLSSGTRRRPAELRQALLVAGADLFAEQGYDATTYRQIAHRAGASPSVLFRHFGTKGNLLVEAVIEPFTTFFTEFSAEWEGPERPGHERYALIREFVGELYRVITERRTVVRAMLSAMQSVEGDDLMRQVGERLASALDQLTGVAEGYARLGPHQPSESAIVVRATIGMVLLVGSMDSWLASADGTRPDDSQIIDVMADLVVRGGGPGRQMPA